VNPRALATTCFALLAIAFTIDLLTPQLFVAAILFGIPIVLSTYAGNRRLTGALIVAALIANVVAGYVNGVQAGSWSSLAIWDRVLTGLSIVLVGMLGLAVHRGAERTGAATALAEEGLRERALREASQRIRSSLSEELVERGIVRESRALVDATKATLFLAAGVAGWSMRFDAGRESPEVVESAERPSAEVQSVLIRALETQEAATVSKDDAMGRLVTSALGCEGALVAPLVDGGTRIGVLLLALDRPAMHDDLRMLRAFAETAAIALAQARIFAELADKNQEVAHRSEVIRDIVYALSHDLRTPLAAAGLTLRQARDGAYGPMPPSYLEILDRSLAANDELQRLAETLLLVAQYESGERTIAHRQLDVARLTRDVATQLESLAKSKGLSVEIDAETEAWTVGDAGELRRALVNLFANAVTWSREGGTVRIRVSAPGERVRVAVEDRGFGVPPELREMLFMRFAAEGKHGVGTGLGLYIVRRIAEAHGGAVRYEPNDPEGSIFTLELPAAAAPAAVAQPR